MLNISLVLTILYHDSRSSGSWEVLSKIYKPMVWTNVHLYLVSVLDPVIRGSK